MNSCDASLNLQILISRSMCGYMLGRSFSSRLYCHPEKDFVQGVLFIYHSARLCWPMLCFHGVWSCRHSIVFNLGSNRISIPPISVGGPGGYMGDCPPPPPSRKRKRPPKRCAQVVVLPIDCSEHFSNAIGRKALFWIGVASETNHGNFLGQW